MRHGHLGERQHDEIGDQGTEDVRNNDAGTRHLDRNPAAQKQTGADRLADSNHAEQPDRQFAFQSGFFLLTLAASHRLVHRIRFLPACRPTVVSKQPLTR